MDWTKDDLKYLLSYKKVMDSDDIRVKQIIKKKLMSNKYIVHVLHNTALESDNANPQDYFGINIFPYYIIPDTQHDIQNFLCYEVSYNQLDKSNKSIKVLQVIFYILCYKSDIIDQETAIARHDMLAALLSDQFNWTNIFGSKISLVQDKASVVDTNYAARTLIFEQVTDNNLVKTNDKIPRIIDRDIVY